MPQRLAGAMSLVTFAVCLLIGGFQADNPFGTTVVRALGAMAATFVVALIIGLMAQKMLDESLQSSRLRKNAEISEANSTSSDR